MRFLIAIVLFAGICTAVKSSEEVCLNSVTTACKSILLETPAVTCNARFGGIVGVEPEFNSYINAQLSKSYEYLLMGTFFNSYQKDRPGFKKLYQGLSDAAFDDTINHIKHLTSRGGVMNFDAKPLQSGEIRKVEGDELSSLAKALENEKALSTSAIRVHGHAAYRHNHSLHVHDPEIAQYFEEEVLEKQAKTIRKLSGYANDLHKIINKNADPSLGIFLFDQYLEKQ